MIIFIILGFVSSIFQLTLLREFTFSIAKNELSLIVAIGIWIASCSLASFLRTKKVFISNLGLAVLLSLGFGACVCLAHLAKSLFAFNYYESVSVLFALGAGFLIMAPMGFLTGYAFSQFNEDEIRKEDENTKHVSHPFAYEALGVLAGGILFTLALSFFTNPLSFCALGLLFIPAIKATSKQKLVATLLIMAVSVVFSQNYQTILKKEFQDARIVSYQGSALGPLIATEKNNTRALYVNGTLAATSEDKETDETFIHTAFSTVKKISAVLWVGPCFTSQLEEMEKYPGISITCVDLNPRPQNLPSFYASGKNVHYVTEDPRRFLKKNKNSYDLIVMNIPAPSALGFNRFFTLEFFNKIKDRLSPDGTFVFAIPSKRDILSPSIKNFSSCILNTLEQVFPSRFIIPSDSMMIVSSRQPVSAQGLMENFEKNQIKAPFFTSFHLKDALDAEKKDYILKNINHDIPINTDLKPYGFVYYLLLEQVKFFPPLSLALKPFKKQILAGVLCVLVVMGFWIARRKELSMPLCAGIFGFCSIGASAIVYFIFQLISGALFWKLGIVVGLFMGGLGAGVFIPDVVLKKEEMKLKYLGWLFLLWLALCLEMFTWANGRLSGFLGEIVWAGFSFECGLVTGAGYTLIVRLWQKKTDVNLTSIAPMIYAADLAGAFLGTLLFSTLFIPFLGIDLCFLILAGTLVVAGLKSLA